MSVNVKENLVSPGLPLCESCMMELIVRMAVEACGEDTILFGGPCCCVMQEKTGVQYYGTMMTNMASSASGVSRRSAPPGQGHDLPLYCRRRHYRRHRLRLRIRGCRARRANFVHLL